MRTFILTLSLLLTGCATERVVSVNGEEVMPPGGFILLCVKQPDFPACPR
jgi:hypothetical protein